MKVLLLNPPGRLPYQRDYYCSKVSKADYLYHPTDLLILSGIVGVSHDVEVLDALAEKLPLQAALRRVKEINPDVVLSLCGAVSWDEDQGFFHELKVWKPTLRLMISGDVVLEGATSLPLGSAPVDALLLDFTTGDALTWIEGGLGEVISNVVYRYQGRWIDGQTARPRKVIFEVPPPRHELFPESRYRFPLLRRRSFATVLTDYGCLHHCRFCVSGNLGYKWRPAQNVLEELDHIATRGYREIYFNDQTFGLERERTEELLRAMVERGYDFGWACWSRVDVIDEGMLELMRAAGCHTVMFGAESADEEILQRWVKGFGPAVVREKLRLCRQMGIRTLATFLIGLPGQDRESCQRTIRFACNCGCDFASFNVPVPRMTTELRRQALQGGWIKQHDVEFDQSGMAVAMSNGVLGADEIVQLRKEAVRAFYLRPSYLAKRVLEVRSAGELLGLLRFGRATLGW